MLSEVHQQTVRGGSAVNIFENRETVDDELARAKLVRPEQYSRSVAPGGANTSWRTLRPSLYRRGEKAGLRVGYMITTVNGASTPKVRDVVEANR
jgi:hypothetical protein